MTSARRSPTANEIALHSPWMRRLARGLVGEGAAEDVVQEAWLWLGAERAGSPRGYVAAVVRTLALRRLRGERRRARREARAARPEALPSAAEIAARVEVARRVAEELERLPEPYRTTLVLRYHDGLSSAEIARRAGIPAGTVRARLKRGLDALRERLDERPGGREGWVSALLPLARPETGAPAALALSLTTLFAMKLVLGTLLALVAVASLWMLLPRGRAVEGPLAERSIPAEVEAERGAGAAAGPETAERALVVAEPDIESDGPPWPAARGLRLRARAVTEDRAGIAHAWLALRSAPDARAQGDADGWLALAAPESLLERLPGFAQGGELELLVGAPMRATQCIRARVAPGASAHELGELVLAPGAALHGRVVDPDGFGVEGALVAFGLPRPPGVTEEASARRGPPDLEPEVYQDDEPAIVGESGAGGAFALEGLRPGHGTCWARTDESLWSWSQPIGLRAGEVVGDVELVVRPAPEAVITGVVTDPDGRSLPHVALTFRRSAGSDGWNTERTDARGRFHFVPPEGEAQTIGASSPSPEWEDLERAGVEPGSRELALAFERSSWLTVEARDEAGEPVRNGRAVGVKGEGATSSRIHRCEGALDAEGRARLRRPGEPLRVRVEAAGFRDALLGSFAPEDFPGPLVVTLERVPAIVGVVLRPDGSPAAGARVSLHRGAGGGGTVRPPGVSASEALRHLSHQGWSGDRDAFVYALMVEPLVEVEADEDGRFRLPMPGVDARAPNEVEEEEGGGLSGLGFPGGSDRLSTTLARAQPESAWFVHAALDGEATLTSGPHAFDPEREAELELQLPRGGSLEGSLVLSNDVSPLGWTLFASDGLAELAHTSASADGSFRFDDLHPGGWQIRAFEPGAYLPTAGGKMVTERSPEPDVVIAAGETTEYVHETRPRAAARLAGRIWIDGTPAGAWSVEVTTRTPQYAYRSHAATLDPEGRFEVELEPGLATRLHARGSLAGAPFSISAEIRIVAGDNEWSCDLETATLRGTVDPARIPEGRHAPARWRVARDGLTVDVEIELGNDGAFGPLKVPAGPANFLGPPPGFLERAPTWAELELAPGEERALEVR